MDFKPYRWQPISLVNENIELPNINNSNYVRSVD